MRPCGNRTLSIRCRRPALKRRGSACGRATAHCVAASGTGRGCPVCQNDPDLATAEDWEWFCQLSRRVLVQVFVPEIIVGCPMGVLDGFVVVGQPLGRIKTFSVAEMFGNVGEKQGLGYLQRGGNCQNGDPGGHTGAHNGARSSQPAGNAGSAQSHDRTAEEEGSKTGNTADAHTRGTGQHFGNGRLGDGAGSAMRSAPSWPRRSTTSSSPSSRAASPWGSSSLSSGSSSRRGKSPRRKTEMPGTVIFAQQATSFAQPVETVRAVCYHTDRNHLSVKEEAR